MQILPEADLYFPYGYKHCLDDCIAVVGSILVLNDTICLVEAVVLYKPLSSMECITFKFYKLLP